MFKFSLEPVLSLREKMEESKKRELGEATQYKERINSEKRMLEQKKEETLESVRKESAQLIDVFVMRSLNQYNQYMDQAIENKNQQLLAAQSEVEKKRQALLEAVKDRKILDNLKSIYRENFDQEEKQAEQRLVDDLVTYRFGNKGKG